MNKPVIVIDLDNVLALSAEGFIAFSNAHFNTSITLDDYSEDWQTVWGVSHDEAERRGQIMREHQIHLDYRPIPMAREVLTGLQKQYKFIILTSRRKQAESYTREWLQLYYPNLFDEIVFSGFFEAGNQGSGHLLTKGQQYKELSASYVIDDHLKHCESAAEVGIPAVLFGDYPWNRQEISSENLARCRNWIEVGTYFS